MTNCTCTCHTGPYAACSVPGGCGSTAAHRDRAAETRARTQLSRLGHAIADVEFILEHWDALADSRIPGTARPWRAPTVSPERREELEHAARLERQERVDVAPGERAIPVHADVLDVMVDICEAAGRLAPQVAIDADCQLVLPFNPFIRGPLAFLAHLDLHLHSGVYDGDLIDQVAVEFRALARDVALALRLLRDGQVVGSCPWCRMPAALTVRELTDVGPIITCASAVACEPPDADCGIRLRGRPAWAQYEWDWLAQRIRHLEDTDPAGRLLPASARAATRDRRAYEQAARDRWIRPCPYDCGRRFPDDDRLADHLTERGADPDDLIHPATDAP